MESLNWPLAILYFAFDSTAMTLPKKPLPSLRFVIMIRRDLTLRLIPQTNLKGRVVPNRWAVPGGQIKSTDALVEWCRQNNWQWQIEGDSGERRRRFYG